MFHIVPAATVILNDDTFWSTDPNRETKITSEYNTLHEHDSLISNINYLLSTFLFDSVNRH